MCRLPSSNNPKGRRSERGATLTGYALTMAVMVVVGLGSMSLLEDNSETFLEDTGSAIGEPRPTAEEAANQAQLASLPSGLNYSNSNGQLNGPVNPNNSTTTTPASSTTSPPSTTPSSTTTSTVPPAVLSASNNFGPFNSADEYDAASAASGPNSGPITLTAGGAGTYNIFLNGVTTGGGSDNSVYVRVNGGPLEPWHFAEGLSGQTVNSNVSVSNDTITLAEGQSVTIVVYFRESGTSMTGVQMVGP